MLPQLAELKRVVLELLFPQWCLGYGREVNLIYPPYHRALPKITPPLCPRCGNPQASGIVRPTCISFQPEIDDVTTSRTTLDACASVLKSSGASSVWGFVLAREV